MNTLLNIFVLICGLAYVGIQIRLIRNLKAINKNMSLLERDLLLNLIEATYRSIYGSPEDLTKDNAHFFRYLREKADPSKPIGQAAFEVLDWLHPELANSIRGTDKDPSEVPNKELDGHYRWGLFCQFLNQNLD